MDYNIYHLSFRSVHITAHTYFVVGLYLINVQEVGYCM